MGLLPGAVHPWLGMVISYPDHFEMSARMRRVWATVTKRTLHRVLMLHWRKRIPLHFTFAARSKYGYKERRPGYKAKKRFLFHSITDLVKTSRTKNFMTTMRPRITVGRPSANIQGLTGRMHMKWPFPTSASKDNPSGVKIDEMAAEIARFTEAEAISITLEYNQIFKEELLAETARSPVIQEKFMTGLGI